MEDTTAKYFKPKNAGESRDVSSPDGKHRLVITPYSTKKDCWSYTQGLVYKTGNSKLLFEVQRNYCSFPYSWIDHPNGHQYLICGEDYQGQTILELNTGKRLDFLPPEAKDGAGFCWVQHRFDPVSKTLVVCGCVWACPYEFRFYDFSNPMEGWPKIETVDTYVDDDPMWPTFESDGTIKTYCTQSYEKEDEEKDTPEKPVGIRATKFFLREGPKLTLIKEEVSEEERIKRQKQEEWQRAYDEKIKLFRTTDPLFLCHSELIKDPVFSPEDHYGIGVTYKDWCPHFKVEEQKFCRRIANHKKYTIDLEWGMVSGPIKVILYKDGKRLEDKWFDHSVEGMTQAFEAIKNELKIY